MPREHLDFTLAYEFADVAVKAVKGEYDIEFLEDFLDPVHGRFWEYARKPHRYTLLHIFVSNLNYQAVEGTLDDLGYEDEYLTKLVSAAGLEPPQWLVLGEIDPNLHLLSNLIVRAVDRVTDASFQLLFSDVAFLSEFHEFVADRVDSEPREGYEEAFTSTGRLKRMGYIPRWLSRAIFHRDRGRCRHCEVDLSYLTSVDARSHVDHLRPLAQSGTNDATNFQLLCEGCNLEKAHNIEAGPWWTEKYW